MKATGHQLEHLSSMMGLRLHKLAYEDHALQYKEKPKTDYYTIVISHY